MPSSALTSQYPVELHDSPTLRDFSGGSPCGCDHAGVEAATGGPQRRPRRGGHRRRRTAGGRDERQRGVRLPRRHPGDDAGGVRRGRTPRGGAGRAGVVRRPRRTSAGSPSTSRPTCCASRWPSRSACWRTSRPPRADGWPTSSRTARSTTGSRSTRHRPSRCWTGRASCRCSGCRTRCCSTWRGSGGGACGSRGSPTGATRTTAGCCRGTRRVRWCTDADEVAARAVELAADVDSVCVHGDSPGAVATAIAVRRALEDAGLVVAPCWS